MVKMREASDGQKELNSTRNWLHHTGGLRPFIEELQIEIENLPLSRKFQLPRARRAFTPPLVGVWKYDRQHSLVIDSPQKCHSRVQTQSCFRYRAGGDELKSLQRALCFGSLSYSRRSTSSLAGMRRRRDRWRRQRGAWQDMKGQDRLRTLRMILPASRVE